MLKGHKDIITDMGWAPYNVNMLASSSKDATVQLWNMDDEEFGTNHGKGYDHKTDPVAALVGHQKQICHL